MDSNQIQLELIDEIARLFDEAGLRFWVRGGWALDFHLGRITRHHADIDLVTWLRHRDRVRRLLTVRGFSFVGGYSQTQLVLKKRGQEASLLFIARRNGRIVVPGYESWPFGRGSFPSSRKTLRGVSARVVSPGQLLYEKLHHEQWSGKPLRPKDQESIKVLRTLVA